MNFDWEAIISSDEKVEKEFGVSSAYLGVLIVITIVLSAVVGWQYFPAGVMLFLLGMFYCFYLKKAKHFAFTNKKVYLVDSFVGQEVVSVVFDQITDVQIEQSFFEQVGGWGTLTINTAGTHSPVMSLANVDNPQSLKKDLDQLANK